MPKFSAPRRRKRLGLTARDADVSEQILDSAGVHVIRLHANGIGDPAQILAPVHGPGRGISLRHGLLRLNRSTRRVFLSAMREAKQAGSAQCEICWAGEGAGRKWFRVYLTAGGTGDTLHWDIVSVDITQDRVRMERLAQESEHLRDIVEHNPQLPWIADAKGRIVEFADCWLRSKDAAEAQPEANWTSMCHPDDREDIQTALDTAFKAHQPFDVTVRKSGQGEYRWVRARGYPRFDAEGNVLSWYGFLEDVHEKVLIDRQISWDAEHDSLTGLFNRTYFTKALAAALAEATASFNKVALILLDLDNFKDINDTGSHGAGDELLRKFAESLLSIVPEGATVARLGSDEFAVMLKSLKDESAVLALAERIVGTEGDFRFGSRSFTYHVSAGLGIFPDHAINADQLLRHADLALYSAKSNGRAQLHLFEMSMLENMHERLAMVNRARTAAKGDRIFAYYQPKICLETGRLAGFEALLRWQDAAGRIRSPASIDAAFEDKGVADMLGKAMINQVLGDIAAWKAHGLPFQNVAINASAAEMRSAAFVDNLFKAMETYDVAENEIEVEITEGVFLGANAHATRHSIQRMNERGIALSLDDFGTGYASLSHLRSLPVSTLKIDRSFVKGICKSAPDHAIVAAIISMGRAMGMRVVAEGIEHVDQAQALRELSCQYGQGFYYGAPVPSCDVPALIRSWKVYSGLQGESPGTTGVMRWARA